MSQQISGCVRLLALSAGDKAQKDQLVDLIDLMLAGVTRFRDALRLVRGEKNRRLSFAMTTDGPQFFFGLLNLGAKPLQRLGRSSRRERLWAALVQNQTWWRWSDCRRGWRPKLNPPLTGQWCSSSSNSTRWVQVVVIFHTRFVLSDEPLHHSARCLTLHECWPFWTCRSQLPRRPCGSSLAVCTAPSPRSARYAFFVNFLHLQHLFPCLLTSFLSAGVGPV